MGPKSQYVALPFSNSWSSGARTVVIDLAELLSAERAASDDDEFAHTRRERLAEVVKHKVRELPPPDRQRTLAGAMTLADLASSGLES